MSESLSIPRRKRSKWPLIVVALLLGHAAIILTGVTMAVRDGGYSVVPDYYQKAVDFDARKADLAASNALGWTVNFTAGSMTDELGRRLLVATLTDAQGQPLTDAAVKVELRHFTGGDVQSALLPAVAPGQYRDLVIMPRPGTYSLDVAIDHGEARFIDSRELEAPGGGGSS